MKNKSSTDKIYFDRLITPPPGDVYHYKLDRNLVYRPEPGCDDGPQALLWDKSWHDPESGDFETGKRQQPLSDVKRNDYGDMRGYAWSSFLKCTYKAQVRIPDPAEALKQALEIELRRIKGCGTVVASFYGRWSGSVFYHPLHCALFGCPECGGKHGFIHERRKKSAFKRMNHGIVPKSRADRRAVAKKYQAGQWVFPLPSTGRDMVLKREGMNLFYGAVKRTMKHFFPDTDMMTNLHPCSEEHPLTLHPQVHVLTFYLKSEHRRLRVTPEIMDAMKDRLAQEYRAIGIEGVRGPGEQIEGKVVVLNYNFATNVKQVMHLINYVSRPLGAEQLEAWQASEEGKVMIDLCVRELKGFRSIRFWGKWAGCRYYDRENVKEEVESIINEPVEFIGYIHIMQLKELISSEWVSKAGQNTYVRDGPYAGGRSP